MKLLRNYFLKSMTPPKKIANDQMSVVNIAQLFFIRKMNKEKLLRNLLVYLRSSDIMWLQK